MCPPASAAPANATAAKAAMNLILFMVWFLSFGVMCFVRWKRRSVRRRARQGARLRSRTSPRCGACRCDGCRGGGDRADASAHDASREAGAEARDALPRVWAQDASARDAQPWVPFLVPSPPEAYAPVPSSPSSPCPSAEDSTSERPSPCRRERRTPRAPSPSSV